MRKYLALLGVMVGVGVVMAMSAFGAGAPAPKVNVCHVDGKGVYGLINVSGNAVPAHLAHGDGLPGGIINGGSYLGADCSLVSRECVRGSGAFVDGTTTFTVDACELPLSTGTAHWVRTSGGFENDITGDVIAANIDPATGSWDVTIQITSSTSFPDWVGYTIKFAVTPGAPGTIVWTWIDPALGTANAQIVTTGFTVS